MKGICPTSLIFMLDFGFAGLYYQKSILGTFLFAFFTRATLSYAMILAKRTDVQPALLTLKN